MITSLVLTTSLIFTGALPDRYISATLKTDGLAHRVMFSAERTTLTCVEFSIGKSPWMKTGKVWLNGQRIAYVKRTRGRTGCIGPDRRIAPQNQKFKVQIMEDFPGPWNPTTTKWVTLW